MTAMTVFEIGFKPTGSLQLKSGCSQLFPEALLAAGRADSQRLVGQFLQYILGKTAFFAMIGINWHFQLQNPVNVKL